MEQPAHGADGQQGGAVTAAEGWHRDISPCPLSPPCATALLCPWESDSELTKAGAEKTSPFH